MQRSTFAVSVMHYVYVVFSSLLEKVCISFFVSPVCSTVGAQLTFTGLMSAMCDNYTIKYFGVGQVNPTKMRIKKQSYVTQ